MELIKLMLEWFDINIKINFSSQLNIKSKKSELVAELVHSVNGTLFI